VDSLLLFNARVRTCDPRRPAAAWVLVQSGRVAGVGSGVPPATHGAAWDLAGRVLIPAFCDAHVHLAWLATALASCDLGACPGIDAALAALAAWRGPGRGRDAAWIVGHGLDESGWPEHRLPTRDELDGAVPHRPVLLQRVCGHVGVLNAAGLARVRPGPHTDVVSGRIAEDDLYALNDALRPGAGELATVLPQVAAELHAAGITAVHDVTSPEMLDALRDTAIDLRVSCALPWRYLEGPRSGPAPHDPASYFGAHGCGDLPVERGARLRVAGLKLFLDGSLGARTAFLRAPYADAPAQRGAALHDRGELAAIVRRADAAGLQLMVHAIGDAAIDLALDVLAPVVAAGNPHRHRLEHVEVTPPDLVERLAASRLHVCVQPNFAGRWSVPGGMNEQRLGAARLRHCNAYRSLHRAGIPLAFGSDCMPLGPLFGLRSAVQHPVPEERLDAAVALDLYTRSSTELLFAEEQLGRIAPGMAADMVVLSHDLNEAWESLRVEATFHAGRLVHGGPVRPVAGPSGAC
jgi:hypothetical protein